MNLHRYLEYRHIAGNSSVNRLSPALDLSFMLKTLKNYSTDEYSTMDNDGMPVPPLACAFAKRPQYQHVLGVVDEDGYLVLYNTHKTSQAAVIKTWQVHANAVFDLEWLQEENKILTGSGDQTIALYDVETCQKLETFKGHASSIKSIANKVGDDAIFVSGSRDGHVMLWDRRIYHRDDAVPPVDTIFNAHTLKQQNIYTGKNKKRRQNLFVRDAQQSVTVVLFQNENYLISAGAVDGCLKVWDIRKTYKRRAAGAQPVHVFQYPGTNTRKHGYSSLVQDSQGRRLFASCTDDVIYEYDMAAYNPKPIQTWRGHKNSTFYVKSALSLDDQYLLSGSTDELAYIYQINKPDAAPITLQSHTAEVTSVAWCPNDITKVVTLSDDTKIKFWRIYCRELKKQSLPHWLGQAKMIYKRRETSKVFDVQIAQASTSSSNTAAPQKDLLQKSSSTGCSSSPKLCIRSWLKRKLPTDETFTDQEASPEKSFCSHKCANDSDFLAHTEIMTTNASMVDDSNILSQKSDIKTQSASSDNATANTEDSAAGSEEISSWFASSPESLPKKRSHDESEDTSAPDSPMFHRTPCAKCCKEDQAKLLENTAAKRLKTEQHDLNVMKSSFVKHDFSSENDNKIIAENFHNLQSEESPLKQPHTSPSKLNRQENLENVPYKSPVKLIKRRPNSVESPVTSPKRPCLTDLVSNTLAANICSVKMSLFTENTHQDQTIASKYPVKQDMDEEFSLGTRIVEMDTRLESNMNIEYVTSKWSTTCPVSPLNSAQELHSSKHSPTKATVCVEKLVTLCKDTLNNQCSGHCDFDSPTRNLPNLVMDKAHNCSVTPIKRKSVIKNQKHNWLTQIRLDKLKKCPETVPKQTNQGKLSPKVTKGMRKINSYFK